MVPLRKGTLYLPFSILLKLLKSDMLYNTSSGRPARKRPKVVLPKQIWFKDIQQINFKAF